MYPYLPTLSLHAAFPVHFARRLCGRAMAQRRSPTTGLQGADTRATGSMVATRASGRAVTSASISPPNKRWLIVEHASPAAAEPASQSASSGHADSSGEIGRAHV